MGKMIFSTGIDASKEKVWSVLWNDASYRTWSSAFTEGSHAITDNWKEGTKVLFLDPKGSGMVSIVAANKPNEFMSFKHIGEVINGTEDTTSERVMAWSGSFENYRLKEADGKTELTVEMDITEEFKEMFSKIWPTALERIKALSEQ